MGMSEHCTLHWSQAAGVGEPGQDGYDQAVADFTRMMLCVVEAVVKRG